ASHVLWAFVLQETRASEILAQYGLTAETLSPLYAPPPGGFDPNLVAAVAQSQVDSWGRLSGDVERLPLFRDLLHQVREQLAANVAKSEIGTEHLLYGLLAAEPTVAIEFRRFGLTLENLARKLDGMTPLPFEADGD